jgi:CO/xanthine dehydrogenase FAD-binding subunit
VRVQEDTAPAGWGKKADLASLGDAESRGASDQIRNEANATLGGTVAGNSATNVSTGMNIIDNGSFANSSGLPVVIQNSGANVLIQNATVINLHMQ